MQAVILAGGLGTRLKPYTFKTPKPMTPIRNQPFLMILLKFLRKNNFKKFLLLVGYSSNVITECLGDGSKLGIEIEYSYEKKPLGTGGALKNSLGLLEDEFILLNGDTYLELDYPSFIKFCTEKNSIITFAAYDGPLYSGISYNMIVDTKGAVKKYSKSKHYHKFNAIDAGVYFVKKTILEYLDDKKSSFEDIFLKLIDEKKIHAYLTKTKFYDIGTIQRLKEFETRKF